MEVVAAVVFDGRRILACQRPEGKGLAGFWEFPGGKLELGETPAEALRRELLEELAMPVRVMHCMYRMEFMTEDARRIVLHFIRAHKLPGFEPRACEGQQFRWLDAGELNTVEWLPSDEKFVEYLRSILQKCKS